MSEEERKENIETTADQPAPQETPAQDAPAPEPSTAAASDPGGKKGKKTKPDKTAPSGVPEGYTPNGYVPGEPKDNFFAEQLRIIKERRLLRRDLKSKGITSRKDFEIIAESLGLVLWKACPLFLWWHHFWKGLIAGWGLKSLLAAAAAALVGVFLISTVTEEKGAFTINLTGEMLRAGFVLSETEGFDQTTSRLFSAPVTNVNNITIEDIDPEVDHIDGSHNGQHYLAYTFYIRNDGKKESTYAWYLRMTGETKDVSKAVWLMLFEDGRQVTYTRATDEDEAESLTNFKEPLPFSDVAYDTNQYPPADPVTGVYGIVTTPYVDEEIVARGLIENVPQGGVHKYTVVIWIEGHDDDCKDEIFGGSAKFEMGFDYIEDEDYKPDIFSGVWRTEYDDYGVEPEEETPPTDEE